MSRNYDENVKGLNKIEGTDIKDLSEDAFIYFGRGSCPFCREFSEEFPEAGVDIYYVDTTDTAVNEALQNVRDIYDVVTVPTFIHRRKDGSFDKLDRDVRQSIHDFVASINK